MKTFTFRNSDNCVFNVSHFAECTIDLYKLKEYSKNWNYWEFEEE